jgi:hypothetical protein
VGGAEAKTANKSAGIFRRLFIAILHNIAEPVTTKCVRLSVILVGMAAAACPACAKGGRAQPCRHDLNPEMIDHISKHRGDTTQHIATRCHAGWRCN